MVNPPGAASVTREDRLPRPKRRRWPIILLSVVVVLLVLLLVADRGGVMFAQSTMASEIQKEGFPAKPKVTIKGFPFLTQVASRHFDDVRLSSSNIVEGPLHVTELNVRARDVRVDAGLSGGAMGSVDGTAFVSFKDLAKAGGNPALELSDAGQNRVRAKVDLAIVEGTATASVTKEGDNIRVKTLDVEGLSASDLDGALDFTIPVSGLPLGMTFQSLTVTDKGVALHVTGTNVKFTDQ